MATKTKITEYDIEISEDHAQYWPGASLVFTDYEDLGIGSGSTPAEAYAEALDELEMNDWDTSTIECDLENDETLVSCECGEDDYAECEHYWYVVVRVR